MRKLALIASLSLLALAPRAPLAQVSVGAGYWGWRAGAQVWIPGRWALPPAYGYVWEPGRWEQMDGGAIWVPGYWHSNGFGYGWVGGRWAPRPAGYGWEPNRWERRDEGRWSDWRGRGHMHWNKGHHRGREDRDG